MPEAVPFLQRGRSMHLLRFFLRMVCSDSHCVNVNDCFFNDEFREFGEHIDSFLNPPPFCRGDDACTVCLGGAESAADFTTCSLAVCSSLILFPRALLTSLFVACLIARGLRWAMHRDIGGSVHLLRGRRRKRRRLHHLLSRGFHPT